MGHIMLELLVLTHDLVEHLDRRIINEARLFIEHGWHVRIVLLTSDKTPHLCALDKGILLDPIPLSACPAPHDPLFHGSRDSNATAPTLVGFEKLKWKVAERLRPHSRTFNLARSMYRRSRSLSQRVKGESPSPASDWYPLPFNVAFVEHARKLRFDAILACDLPALPAARELAHERRVPLIYDSHELYVEQSVFSAKQKMVMEYHERWCAKKADLFFTVAPRIAQAFQQKYGLIEPPKVIYNSPSFRRPESSDSGPPTGAIRARLGIPHGSPLLMYHGGFSSNRNLETLIKSFAKLDHPDAHLLLLGYGDERESFRRLAQRIGKNRILVQDAVAQDELPAWITEADAVVIPYPANEKNNEYALPNKLFDCIVLGVPVIANEVLVSIGDILRAHGVGIAGPMNNEAAIRQTLQSGLEWLKSDRRRQADFESARRLYCWDTQKELLRQWLTTLRLPGFVAEEPRIAA
jgi:glycosyltransferase involved in cell wall biosynthesis